MSHGASVAELLNAAQESAAACDRCAGSLWKLILKDADAAFDSLTSCVDHLLTVSQVSDGGHHHVCVQQLPVQLQP